MRRNAALVATLVTLVVLATIPWWTATTSSNRLFLVTPTKDDLTRYSHMLMLAYMLAASPFAPRVVWIVVEDAPQRDPAIEQLLVDSGITHHYLHRESHAATVHRGVELRNAALDFLATTTTTTGSNQGVVYFADDDNAYRPDLWPELLKLPVDAYTVFAVGNTGYYGWEGPVVAPSSSPSAAALSPDAPGTPVVIEQWCCDYCLRRWNVDMGGFAFHTSLLGGGGGEGERGGRPVRFDLESKSGFLESDLLDQLERQPSSALVIRRPLLDRVHVWHNFGKPFDRAGLYDADWTTEASVSLRLRNASDVARGFTWAAPDLPTARILGP
ncbi:hypothetical protein JCM3775_003221 [Rhodotorula graminis]|uniref:Glycosyltransferase family 43 protein n=1 Tax=Rhodotorula graminis (strain WP1) TaxID=578459 RepID=A0A0P9EVT5_RHOGW|nr:glycosyltransferase family 43 protein [Rhodotorula graminis WP1]KPV73289.1 glycosyltransferase family 43 protein [Rhodotorula graminis WP1]